MKKIKEVEVNEFCANKAPLKILKKFQMFEAACWIKKLNDNNEKINNIEISKLFNLNNSTISRLNTRRFAIHKMIMDFIELNDVCNCDREEKFSNFMIKFILPNLSSATIAASRFLRHYAKLGIDSGDLDYKILYKREPIDKPKKEKRIYTDHDKKRMKDKFNKIMAQNSKLNSNPKPKKQIELKKVHIIANSSSSTTIKKLAKKYNCKIYKHGNLYDYFLDMVRI